GEQQRLDPSSQLRIGRAFVVEDGGAGGGILMLEGREEHGLDALRIDRHRSVLPSSGFPPRTPAAASPPVGQRPAPEVCLHAWMSPGIFLSRPARGVRARWSGTTRRWLRKSLNRS